MIILVGQSASGKTEIAKELVNKYGFKKLVTYTSRAMRVGEVEGKDYNFVSAKDFEDKIKNNFFFEYVFYNNNYYGTAFEDITDDKVVILEPKGLNAYLKSNLVNVISFYLDSSEEKRRERMIFRKDDPERIKERLLSDRVAFSKEKIEGVNFILNSNDLSVSELSKEINDLYKRMINNEQ